MAWKPVLFVLLLGASAAAVPESEPILRDADRSKIGELVAEYFEARSEDNNRGMAKAYEELSKKLDSAAKSQKIDSVLISPADLRAVFATPPMLDKRPKKGFFDEKKASVPVLGGLFEFSYLLRIPREYRNEPTPTILALHPGLERLDEVRKWAETVFPEAIAEKTILIIPLKVGEKQFDWTSIEGRQLAFWSLRDAYQKYAIDRLRTFLEGHGPTARAATSYAVAYPGSFTGVILRSLDSAPPTERLANARHLPFLLLAPPDGDASQVMKSFAEEAEAKGVKAKLVETTYGENGAPDEAGTAALLEMVEQTRKDPAPARIQFTTPNNQYVNSYWLRLDEFEATEEKPVTVEGEVIREKNEIIVKTPPTVSGFFVYLNDDLVDMGKPIKLLHTVVTDGEPQTTGRFEGVRQRNLDKALEMYFSSESGNFGEVYTNSIQVKVPR